MENTVMTVTGPISTDDLGMTLMHEHVTFAYPGWFADDSLAPYSRRSGGSVMPQGAGGCEETRSEDDRRRDRGGVGRVTLSC